MTVIERGTDFAKRRRIDELLARVRTPAKKSSRQA
jgi:hypothetical protein